MHPVRDGSHAHGAWTSRAPPKNTIMYYYIFKVYEMPQAPGA